MERPRTNGKYLKPLNIKVVNFVKEIIKFLIL